MNQSHLPSVSTNRQRAGKNAPASKDVPSGSKVNNASGSQGTRPSTSKGAQQKKKTNANTISKKSDQVPQKDQLPKNDHVEMSVVPFRSLNGEQAGELFQVFKL